MVALVSPSLPDNAQAHFAAGVLVHRRYVLTAAQPVIGVAPADIAVVVGIRDLANDAIGRSEVDEVIIHPDYNSYSTDSDLALLRLKNPLPPSTPVLPLLDDTALEVEGSTATMLGWGLNSCSDSTRKTVLQKVAASISSLAAANGVDSYDGVLSDRMIPATSSPAATAITAAEAGGPLLIPSTRGGQGYMLAGLRSFSIGCGDPSFPVIYARITSLRRFVLDQISPNYSAWEKSTGQLGEFGDSNHDNKSNWAEFAFAAASRRADGGENAAESLLRLKPISGKRYPAITFRRPVASEEIGYALAYSTGLVGSGQTLYPLESLVKTITPLTGNAAGAEQIEVTFPSALEDLGGSLGFFRVVAESSAAVAETPRNTETFPTWASGSLTDLDAQSAGRYHKRYRIQGSIAPGATTVAKTLFLSLRSADFDARLELRNSAGASLAVVDADAAGGIAGTDEILTYLLPVGAFELVVEVSTSLPGETGAFELAMSLQSVLDSYPVLAAGPATHATLTPSDGLDPMFVPGFKFNAEDYRFQLPPATGGAQQVTITLASNAFDPFVEILNAETGQLAVIVFDDNSGPGDDASLTFSATRGMSYIVRVTSAEEKEAGSYTLSVTY